MRADADEAVGRFAAGNIVDPAPVLMQGIAQVLSGELDGGDATLQDAASIADKTGAHDVLAIVHSERSLLAMTRGDWSRAEVLAGQARTALRRARLEESYLTPLVCAAQARAAMHLGMSQQPAGSWSVLSGCGAT